MIIHRLFALVVALAYHSLTAQDLRDARTGVHLPKESYADQPYIVKLPDGAWLCLITTSQTTEGGSSQHVIATRSVDQGRSWSRPINVEPPGPPESSWAVPLLTPSGRVYVFYNYNHDNVRQLRDTSGAFSTRVDTTGKLVFKYSDDGGLTWSASRFEVPLRIMDIDRANPYQGERQWFWSVGPPLIHQGRILLAVAKQTNILFGFGYKSESVIVRSGVIENWDAPDRFSWETFPAGEAGIKSPRNGAVAEEPVLVPMSDGRLYMSFRTVEGYAGFTTVSGDGTTFNRPDFARYTDGRSVKNARSFCPVFKTASGHYLLWFVNHSGRGFDDRNPIWIAVGQERNGALEWSQPEILLYDADPLVRMSYPSLVEAQGTFWITETDKNNARIHPIAPELLNGLFSQFDNTARTPRPAAVAWSASEGPLPSDFVNPIAVDTMSGGGFSVEILLDVANLGRGLLLLDGRNESGAGWVVGTTANNSLSIALTDGATRETWDTDPGILQPGASHHIVFTVDARAKVISVLVDGRLQDGGTARQFGWSRYRNPMSSLGGSNRLTVNEAIGRLRLFRIYDTPLRVSEAVGNYRSSRPGVRIVEQPASVRVDRDSRVALGVTVEAIRPYVLQWYAGARGDTSRPLANFNSRIILIEPRESGSYWARVSAGTESVDSNAALVERLLPVAPTGGRIANLSVRSENGRGEVIVGFYLAGSVPTGVLARCAGPSLAQLGITNGITDPELGLYSGNHLVGYNDDWSELTLANRFVAAGAFPFLAEGNDAAFYVEIEPGSYTLHAADKPGRGGIAFVDLYTGSHFSNLSVRSHVYGGVDNTVAGFSVSGGNAVVLLRAVGPSLHRSDALSDYISNPLLTVRDGQGRTMVSNRGWTTDDEATISYLSARTGAFPLTSTDDAAIAVMLAPGGYTVGVTNAEGGGGGAALLEIYSVE